jgi:hypothetical protein
LHTRSTWSTGVDKDHALIGPICRVDFGGISDNGNGGLTERGVSIIEWYLIIVLGVELEVGDGGTDVEPGTEEGFIARTPSEIRR